MSMGAYCMTVCCVFQTASIAATYVAQCLCCTPTGRDGNNAPLTHKRSVLIRNFNASFAGLFAENMSENISVNPETFTETMPADAADVNYVFILFTAITMLTSIIGNFIVFLVTAKTHSLHRISNALIISLAAADFTRATTCMPLSTALWFVKLKSVGFDTLFNICSIYQALHVSLGLVSTLNLVFISVERVFTITNPLVYQRVITEHRMAALIAALWVAGFSYGWLKIMWFHKPAQVSPPQFVCRYVPSLVFGSIHFILAFVVPLTVMTAAYAKIITIVHSQMRRISSSMSVTIPSCWLSRRSCHAKCSRQTASMQSRDGAPANVETCVNMATCNHCSCPDITDQTLPSRNTGRCLETPHDNIRSTKIHTVTTMHDPTNANTTSPANMSDMTSDHVIKDKVGITNKINRTATKIAWNKNKRTQRRKTLPSDMCVACSHELPLTNVITIEHCVSSHLASHRSSSLCSSTRQRSTGNNDNCPTIAFPRMKPKVQVISTDGNVMKMSNDVSDMGTYRDGQMTSFVQDPPRSISTIASKCPSATDSDITVNTESWVSVSTLRRSCATNSRYNSISSTTSSDHRKQSPISQLLDNKATKMTATVIGTFLLCWMPYEVIQLMACVCDVCVADLSLTVVHMITYVASAINPFIYNFYSCEFRRAFRKVLWNRASRRVFP